MRKRNRRLADPLDIGIRREPLLSKSSAVFTLGSCFAIELRNYMRANGYNVLEVDSEEDIKGANRLAWYNTHSLRYEFEMALGSFTRDSRDWWEHGDKWQCGIRRLQFADTLELLIEKVMATTRRVIAGICGADVIVLTLGLIECWRQPQGNVICASPRYSGGGGSGCEFEIANYDTNMNNLRAIMDALKELNESAKVVLTVSPVPMALSFRRDQDQYVSNCESKSTLRAAAGQLAREHSQVTYFPSYELVTSLSREDAYMLDGRHVKRSVVADIMQKFEEAHVEWLASSK